MAAENGGGGGDAGGGGGNGRWRLSSSLASSLAYSGNNTTHGCKKGINPNVYLFSEFLNYTEK